MVSGLGSRDVAQLVEHYSSSAQIMQVPLPSMARDFSPPSPLWGGIAQGLEHWTRDRKPVAGLSPQRTGRRIFLLLGQLSVLTLISVSISPPCYRSSM